MFTGFCRLARESELPAVAELRYQADRGPEPAHGSEKALFVEDFVRIAAGRPRGEVLHWVLEVDGVMIATRSAIMVRDLPEPEALFGRAALVSRCYHRPGSTGNAAAARLLSAIEDWALQSGVELIAARDVGPWSGREPRAPSNERPGRRPLLVA